MEAGLGTTTFHMSESDFNNSLDIDGYTYELISKTLVTEVTLK